MKTYDALVIGSGQGGNPLSHKLADRGWSVALVEREHLGGTCVNYGCTPTKTMIASAAVAHEARRASELGVSTGDVRVNIGDVIARKRKMVEGGRSGQQKHADERETLDVIRGHARFAEPRTVDVDGERLRGEHVFVDVGTRPRIPRLQGIDEVDFLTNRTIMEVTEIPDHLLVLGGGYVGLEFAQMFCRFGSSVTVIQRAEQLVPREDEDVAEELRAILEKEDVKILTAAKATSVRSVDDRIEMEIEGRESISGSHLLLAAGRMPNTDDLGLENAGVETDEHGFVVVNDRLETTAEKTWAIGDVKGGPAFTHIAYDDHLIIYGNVVEGADRSTTDRVVPYALYTDPELGRVGMTEKEARQHGYALKIGKVPVSSIARANEMGRTEGVLKIVIDAATDRVLGAAMLAPHGGELVQVVLTLMMADAPWTLLKRAVYIHPTLTEGFFGLMESVEEV